MSDDVIGWHSFKDVNLRKNLDLNEVQIELINKNAEDLLTLVRERGYDDTMLKAFIELLFDFLSLQRMQIIWINALREGLMELEDKINP